MNDRIRSISNQEIEHFKEDNNIDPDVIDELDDWNEDNILAEVEHKITKVYEDGLLVGH